ncbi:MAG: hypothetical protein E6K76_05305 [Candidatus Eisenbacteria bacterium]|uniref:Lipoprotein n=1 Tax=Eiseniibacteriota bacterium TaxID=2212470 RepID=A0A538T6Z1_UNCEI|nr:MAG: hypothetical protein E6K76_05305 [Candidatus Eisenbacteria bacterium]
MKPPQRIALAGFLLCGTLAGCASESTLLRLDTGLTEADLRQGKIAVLGVVKYQEPDQVRPPLVAMLERTLAEERRDIPLIRADSVRSVLGPERYRRILLAYEYQGTLDSAALREIADSLRGKARFVVLARVTRERIRNSARGVSAADTGVIRPEYAMGITGRDASVQVHLYDVSRSELVMSAAYEGSSENSKPILASVLPGAPPGVTVEVGPQAVPPESQGYPPPPELALALEEPFRAFARALPVTPRPPVPPQPAGSR